MKKKVSRILDFYLTMFVIPIGYLIGMGISAYHYPEKYLGLFLIGFPFLYVSYKIKPKLDRTAFLLGSVSAREIIREIRKKVEEKK